MANNRKKSQKRRGKAMFMPESIQKEWTKIKKYRETKAPAVSVESDDLEDVFAWGSWVAERGNITPQRSKELLRETRKIISKK